ncbi:MAG: 50S ribosomal protein L13 [bacterium]|nr:50S ribosomal protein L13 [bacterium]
MIQTKHKNKQTVTRTWYSMNADGITLGRLSSEVARILRGKHKPIWSPHVDTGDFVIVYNAEKVVLTGNKSTSKTYFIQSPRPGSSKHIPYQVMLKKHPTEVIRHAVWGMLPRGPLANRMIRKLKLVVGPDITKFRAQKPTEVSVENFRKIS